MLAEIPPGYVFAGILALLLSAIPAGIAGSKRAVGIGVLLFCFCVAASLAAGLGLEFGLKKTVGQFYFGIGVLVWVLSVVWALAIKDRRATVPLRTQFVVRPKKRKPPAAPETPAQAFNTCPRCGQSNNVTLTACWNCKLPFSGEVVQVAALPVAPPEVVEPPSAYAPETIGSGFGVTQAVDDATPIMADEPASASDAKEIKVRCKACRKKFSGTAAKIGALKSCPRCKHSPFDVIAA
ncbi:MAG: hypothetical protein IT462_03720 [Planctomycetes bacterium]|nr:hypothetical protein [Planctomycetota bacterium]